jgi:hypothetical protein
MICALGKQISVFYFTILVRYESIGHCEKLNSVSQLLDSLFVNLDTLIFLALKNLLVIRHTNCWQRAGGGRHLLHHVVDQRRIQKQTT